MYDPAPVRGANDRFWQAIRARLGHGPETLTRDGDLWEVWQSPDLILAQTCGMPFRTALHGKVQLVGTPDYGLPGSPPGYYHSVLVIRADDPRQSESGFAGARFAYNEPVSQSGWAAPMVHLRARAVQVGDLLRTGAHAASARAVAKGRADLAGIDALTWQLLCEHDPVAQDLRVLARTEPTPGLPYITAPTQDAQTLFDAVSGAIADLADADRRALHLRGLVPIPAETYLAVPTPPAPDQ
ncbi:phosphate/phosphite/phosphonate ABC transporter substrate-binding protein [Aestuariivita boseongensis]|uniref:phosphate/phosphite/phosphonate ABC transporter substrate-binding protein n=1 Tax=Aestuariivita boseongensis TaxID=1470562 RepID=UPI0012F92BC7|nr:PhnD/SsuA/transferrin family substrate-binding protein [Aestuariivita boseongensis]